MLPEIAESPHKLEPGRLVSLVEISPCHPRIGVGEGTRVVSAAARLTPLGARKSHWTPLQKLMKSWEVGPEFNTLSYMVAKFLCTDQLPIWLEGCCRLGR